MDANDALARVAAWRDSPNARPDPRVAREVATILADRILQLEQHLRLAVGRNVMIQRGNPGRGPESGAGYGRLVPAVIEDPVAGPWQVRCKLLVDDPGAAGAPNCIGDTGVWSISQILFD